MKKFTLLWWLPIAMLLLNSCTQYAYYQSPFQTNTASYKTMPLYSDSIRSAIYAHATFTTGGANYQYHDGVNGGIASIYRSHTSKHLQAFYGLTGILGSYKVNTYHGDPHNKNLDTVAINNSAGGNFFGGWGATGGISYNLPFDKHEWRIGAELSWQQEFGRYLNFRRSLPDTAVNLISPQKNYTTVALTSDLVFKVAHGSVGWKMALVGLTRQLQAYDKERVPYKIGPAYMSQTLHVTWDQFTGFTQLNFGTYTMSFQLGLNYRLHKK